MNPICLIAGHHRSRKRAQHSQFFAGWKSVCRHCGQPMVRVAPGEWRLESEVGQEEADS